MQDSWFIRRLNHDRNRPQPPNPACGSSWSGRCDIACVGGTAMTQSTTISKRSWDINHALEFYSKRSWTLELAAEWLNISEEEFTILLKVWGLPVIKLEYL